MNVSSVKEWTVLSAIKSKLESNSVSMLDVFGVNGEEVIYVTNDDDVYAFGENKCGVLGLGHKNAVKEPTIVEILCGKGIKLIQSNNYNGCNYVLALTKSGEIYSWGWNYYGTLGNGSVKDCFEPNLINALNGVRIIDVCCGCHHNLALSESGEVYGWGYNCDGRVGNGGIISRQTFPVKVAALSDVNISSIACGGCHSMAVSESGILYVWGYNGYGQLGIGNKTNQIIPIRVDLSEKITKVCGGLHHTLLLSSNGDVYAVGYNSDGQIGNGSKDSMSTPVKIAIQSKIAYILASNSLNFSLALSVDNKCFVWGVKGWTVPTEVVQNNMIEAFNNCLDIKVTLKPLTFTTESTPLFNASLQVLNISGKSTPLMHQRFCRSFNAEELSDIKFIIDGKYIFAQKLYLKSVSKHFYDFFANYCLESSNYTIPITQYSYPVFYSFLQYLYTNKVNVKPEEVLELLDLAISYSEEELKNECIDIIKTNISVENVCQIFMASLKHNCEELADYCPDFASNKLSEICKTECFHSMDKESMAQLICKIYK